MLSDVGLLHRVGRYDSRSRHQTQSFSFHLEVIALGGMGTVCDVSHVWHVH
jgi:hypothetical protein